MAGRKAAPAPAPTEILEEAYEIIRGDRARFYGDPRVNVQAIAEGWQAYLRAKLSYLGLGIEGDFIDSHDVCEMMIVLKTMRGAKGYHRDSTLDAAGYAAIDEIVSDDEAYDLFREEVLS